MIKQFFPTICPECGSKLSIELGKSGTYKLMCINENCIGQDFKKFEKGLLAIGITGLGPANIKLLFDTGIDTIEKFFNKEYLNYEFLVESEYFKEGRALDKLLNSIYSVKEISINKIVECLQIDNIGTSFSIQIGKMLSNVPYDFTGYSIDCREDLSKSTSIILEKIKDFIELLNYNDIKVVYYEKAKKTEVKKIENKRIDFVGSDSIKDFILNLNFNLVDSNTEDCDMLIIENKDIQSTKIDNAKLKGTKILTFNQAKILLK